MDLKISDVPDLDEATQEKAALHFITCDCEVCKAVQQKEHEARWGKKKLGFYLKFHGPIQQRNWGPYPQPLTKK